MLCRLFNIVGAYSITPSTDTESYNLERIFINLKSLDVCNNLIRRLGRNYPQYIKDVTLIIREVTWFAQGCTANKKVAQNLKLVHLPSKYNMIRMVPEKPFENIAQLSCVSSFPKPGQERLVSFWQQKPFVLFSCGNFPVVLDFTLSPLPNKSLFQSETRGLA